MIRFLYLLSFFTILMQACYIQPVYEREGDSVLFKSPSGQVHALTAYSDDIIRVSFKDGNLNGDRVYAPISNLESIPLIVDSESKEKVVLSTRNIKVEVKLNPIRFSFYDRTSGLKLAEEKGFHQKGGDTTALRFSLLENEKIYGTGSRAIPLNLRGERFMNYNKPWYGYGYGAKELNFNIPHYLSSNNYMVLIDNPAKAWFDIGATETDILDFSSLKGNMSYYFINGSDFSSLIDEYTNLTGKQELVPIWALGNIHSRFGYRNREEVESSVNSALKAGYPVDAVVLDIYWFGPELEDGRMGRLEWDLESWPEPKEMIDALHEKGIKVVSVSEPFFTLKSGNFEILAQENLLATDSTGDAATIPDFYFGEGGLLDIFNPKAKNWMWDRYKRLKNYGIDGWWVDLGEPEKHPDYMRHYTGTATEVHGVYGHEWSKMMYENNLKDFPGERLFYLARAGFAGSQRYGIIPWSGDVSRSWSGFKAQLPIMLNMSVSGMGYMHSDAGGFSNVPNGDNELYIRWLQYAVFTPVFRPHADEVVPSEPVNWPEEVQNIVKPFVKLRYDLLPFNYTLAFKNSNTGMPLARPLHISHGISDTLMNQYMWGNSLMIAPVLNPGVEKMKIYLPEGGWYDFFTGEYREGSRWIESELSIKNFPVFVAAGSVLPMTDGLQKTTEYPYIEQLKLHYYFDTATSSSQIYFDDGITREAITGDNYQLFNVLLQPEESSISLKITSKGIGYPDMPESRTVEFKINGLPQNVSLSVDKGRVVDNTTISFELKDEIQLKISF